MNQAQRTAKHDMASGHRDLRDRVDHAREVVDTVRERAEIAIRERPYLVPVAAGAAGFGLGLLLASRLTRFILFTAVGAVVTDVLGGELKRIGSDLVREMQHRLKEGDADGTTAE